MNYNMIIDDKPEWINSIYAIKDTKDTLHLSINLGPKHLDSQMFSGTNNGINEQGINFFKDENTLRADKDGWCEVKFEIDYDEKECSIYSYMNRGRYSVDIVYLLVKDKTHLKTLYEKENKQ